MKHWYEVSFEAWIPEHGVWKHVQAAVHSNCDWSDQKLEKAIVSLAESEGVAEVNVLKATRMYGHSGDRTPPGYDRTIDIDKALGI